MPRGEETSAHGWVLTDHTYPPIWRVMRDETAGWKRARIGFCAGAAGAESHVRRETELRGVALLSDLHHDFASGVPARDPRQRLARLVQWQHCLDLRAQPSGIDQAAQRLQPLPVDVGGERFASDAALQLGGRALQNDGNDPAAVADRADGLFAGLAAGTVQQQVDATGNRGTHLLGPVGGVVVEHVAGVQASQVIMVAWAGHGQWAGTHGRRDLYRSAAHASRGSGDEHGFTSLQPAPLDQALKRG